jgi:hypothetical protein
VSLSRRRLVQGALLTTFWPAVWAGTSGSTLWEPIDAARHRAAEAGRPLLVIVAPDDPWGPSGRHERGLLLGALLNHGSDAQLAPLALCEVVCAAPDAVERAVDGAAPLADDVWFVLVEPGSSSGGPTPGPTIRTASVPLADIARDDSETDWERQEEVFVRARLARVADAIGRLVVPGIAALERYEALRGEPDASVALALSATKGDASREAADAILADMARAQWVDRVVPGSRWDTFQGSGCGSGYRPEDPTLVERVERVAGGILRFGMGCGMGHASELTRRMLRFY